MTTRTRAAVHRNRPKTARRRRRLTLLGALLAAPLALPPLAAADPSCAGFVTDRDPRAVPRLARPAYLEPYRDPVFGSRITRVSDAPRGRVVKTLYGTVQPWNADETRLVLYHTGGPDAGHHLYDGRNYRHLGQLPFAPSDIEDLFWDPKRASSLYYVQRKPRGDAFFGKLVRYDVGTRTRRAIADVLSACGNAGTSTVPGAGVDVQGMYGDHVGLRCRNGRARGSEDDVTFYVDVRSGAIGPTLPIGPRIGIGGATTGSLPDVALAATPSNRRFLLQGSVYDRDLRFLRRLDVPLARNGTGRRVPKAEHESIGQLRNGRDALFTPQYDPAPNGCGGDTGGGVGTLVAHDLQSGRCRVAIGPGTGWDYPLSGVHHSSVSRARGWVATSSVGYGRLEYLSNGRPAPPLFSEIALTRIADDGSTTCRLAHIRTHGKSARRTARDAYFGEPHPVISPSGTRILFNSDWYDSGTVDTYVIDLAAGADGASRTPAEPARDRTPERVATPSVPTRAPNAVAAPPDGGTPGFAVAAERRRYSSGDEKVVVRFDAPRGVDVDRVTLAVAGSPDRDWKMWLYTNGTQRRSRGGPSSGRLEFWRLYLGRGEIEARLFRRGSDEVVARSRFTIGD